MKYFGTDLNSAGHFLWDVAETMLYNRGLGFNEIPFDPESLPRYEKGEQRQKGDVRFYFENCYSICAIEGSCIDQRGGTKSVFFIKEDLTQEELVNKIKDIPIAMQIIDKMPFSVQVFKPKP